MQPVPQERPTQSESAQSVALSPSLSIPSLQAVSIGKSQPPSSQRSGSEHPTPQRPQFLESLLKSNPSSAMPLQLSSAWLQISGAGITSPAQIIRPLAPASVPPSQSPTAL